MSSPETCVTLFLHPEGDLNMNPHQLMGTLVTVVTKIEVPLGKNSL